METVYRLIALLGVATTGGTRGTAEAPWSVIKRRGGLFAEDFTKKSGAEIPLYPSNFTVFSDRLSGGSLERKGIPLSAVVMTNVLICDFSQRIDQAGRICQT
jgi:hypothetical protein